MIKDTRQCVETEEFEWDAISEVYGDTADAVRQVELVEQQREQLLTFHSELARSVSVLQDQITCGIRQRFQLLARLARSPVTLTIDDVRYGANLSIRVEDYEEASAHS